MKVFRLLCLAAGLSWAAMLPAQDGSTSPRDIGGVRFGGAANPVADSNASFTLGLTLDGGQTFRTSARVSETVRVAGTIRPEPEHLGQAADIYVVDRINLAFFMQNQDGLFVPWNGRVPDLVPVLESVTLQDTVEVEVFAGRLQSTGDHRFFLGYLPADGGLRYTPQPLVLAISEPSAGDQAFELFSATISPQIIGTRCIQCHVAGGQAAVQGAMHVFRQPLSANLQGNFDIFAQLVSARGMDYILTKVRGGNFHGGGVQLTSSSTSYARLQEFLTLVQQSQGGASVSTQGGSGGSGGSNNPPPGSIPDPYGEEGF